MNRKILLFFSLLFIVIFVSGCEFSLAADITPPPGARQSPPTSPPQEVSNGPNYPLVASNPEAGEAIYVEKCEPCHGKQGMGNGPQASQLPNPVPAIGRPDVSREAKPSEWYEIVSKGNLERYMPPFSSLTEGQRWDVIAYVLSLSASADDISIGQSLYESNCVDCHGDFGKGDGNLTESLPTTPFSFTNQNLMAQRSGNDIYQAIKDGVGEGMPAYGEQLSDDQIWALTSYLRNLSFASVPLASSASNDPDIAGSTSTEPEASGENVQEGEPAESNADTSEVNLPTGVITGQVINGSGGSIPTDILLTLHGLDHMEVISTSENTINADGTFTFENVEFAENRVYVVTADYGGSTYGSDVGVVEPGIDTLDLPLTIYDTTTDPSVLSADRLHVFFDFSRPGVVQVVELYVISNPTNKTIVAAEQGGGVVNFTLPEGATNLQFQEGTLGDRYLETPDGFDDTAPVQPGQGQYQVMVAFDMPYDKKMDLEQSFSMPIDAMIVMTPADGVKLRSDYLQDDGTRDVQGEQFQMYTGSRLGAGDNFSFSLSGYPGETGMLNLPGSSNTTTSLAIGLGALGLVMVVAGVWLYRRNASLAKSSQGGEVETTELAEEMYNDPDMIMDAIIALDDLYSAGEIPVDAYQQRRTELKDRLRELTEE